MTIDIYGRIVPASDELYHFGIKGMHWGIRRFQPYPSGHTGGKYVGKKSNGSSSGKSSGSRRSRIAAVMKKPLRAVKKVKLSKGQKRALIALGAIGAASVAAYFGIPGVRKAVRRVAGYGLGKPVRLSSGAISVTRSRSASNARKFVNNSRNVSAALKDTIARTSSGLNSTAAMRNLMDREAKLRRQRQWALNVASRYSKYGR